MDLKSHLINHIVFISLSCFFVTGSTGYGSDSDSGDTTSSKVLSYTTEDATLAFESFNKHFYSLGLNLYYSTTEREDLGSIWTQVIFWMPTSEPGTLNMRR